MIDIRDIQAFLAILDEGSISKAAESMGMTQPALSLKLKKMENELGVELFQRTPRSMVPLDTSLAIEVPAREIMQKMERVKESLAKRISDLRGTVRVGCLTGWVNTLALPLIQYSQREAPDINLRIEVGQTAELLKAISLGHLDLAIVAKPFANTEGVTCKHLISEQLVLVGHDLPIQENSPRFKSSLLKRQWITLSPTDSLVERYWKETFNEEFPWEKIRTPIVLNHIFSIRDLVAGMENSAAVLPSQVVLTGLSSFPRLKIHLSVLQSNSVFVIWRENGLELQRLQFVQQKIFEVADGIKEQLSQSIIHGRREILESSTDPR